MPIIHYLNVRHGDCSIIAHHSGRITVIDVSNAQPETGFAKLVESYTGRQSILEKGPGNFNQKNYPVNPISYLKAHGITSVFRFIATHPDMDHLDGIKALFKAFSPVNFWDTDNKAEKDFQTESRFDEDDWLFYKRLRDTNPQANPKRLTLYSGSTGSYWNRGADGTMGGDGLYILAPTPELVKRSNETDDYNDCSYVLLYRTGKRKIIFGGDSHDTTWDHILKNHEEDVTDVDLLIAPHHGRSSSRSYDFLDVLKPKITFFGNANSEHLAYSAWNYRKLPFITNNQAGCMIADAESDPMSIFVTHRPFVDSENRLTFYSERFQAYYYMTVWA